MPQAVNPATGVTIAEYAWLDPQELERRLCAAQQAFPRWAGLPFADRALRLRAVAELLLEEKGRHARLMSEEMGKPIVESEAEILKCAWVCEYFAHEAERLLSSRRVETDASKSGVRHEPLGALLGVMPWNFPYWQVFRFGATALMAGNVVLLKHAPNVPGCSAALQELFGRAGFPEGVYGELLVPVEQVEAIIAHPAVRGVALTGSVAAGRAVAACAGAAIKKTVLELGGSDPFIVLADADLERTAESAVTGRMLNSGQSCIASKRFIVEQAVAAPFEELFREKLAALVVGNPLDRATQVGPLARADLREALHDQVRRSVAAGARLALGGEPLGGPGFFYRPTLLLGVRPGMAAFDEETFGPLAAVTRARDAEQAIELANRTEYGLGACLWTADAERGRQLAARIEAGCVFVNSVVRSDPRLPFGGIKRSGYGRELGEEGILEFVNRKTVWVD